MSMDGIHVCKEIADLHDNIVSAEIVEKGITIASHVKSGTLTKLGKTVCPDRTLHEYSTGKCRAFGQTTLFNGT